MKNPYTILGIPQDADDKQIVRSQFDAMRKHVYSQQEVAAAQAALRKPASRLAADFTFPIVELSELPILSSSIKSEEIDLSIINNDKYDSLK